MKGQAGKISIYGIRREEMDLAPPASGRSIDGVVNPQYIISHNYSQVRKL